MAGLARRVAQLLQTFQALADPTRLAIVERLRQGPATLTEVAQPFDMTLAAVLKHVRVLESAGIVARPGTGRTRHLRLRAKPIQDAAGYLESYRIFWEGRLDSLGAYLDHKHPE